ncbi:hypothetical protein CRUP_007289, partial [Coryphaenoides rupestris]
GSLSNSLFTFKTSGCYGTLGLESGGVADAQLSASSAWEWHGVWAASGARLRKTKGRPAYWITTSGSGLREYTWYVSVYRVLHSTDGLRWLAHREGNSSQDKIFQGNTNYAHEVRNNFIPPMEARYVRINPTQWHQHIAL